MKLKLVLIVALFPLLGLASGNVNTLVKFPPKAKSMDTESEKCKADETLKACMERIKSMDTTTGGGK